MSHARKCVIRNARLSDLPRLMELEELCWAASSRVPGRTVRQRLLTHPMGQVVVEAAGVVQGVIYSQRIESADDLLSSSFDTADRLHRRDGPVAHVLSLNIDPGSQGHRYGELLLEHLLTWCRESEALETAVGVTRCRDFDRHSEPELGVYIHATTAQGLCLDTVLRMHQLHGARIRCLVPGYRPGDSVNGGHGVLVTYDLSRRAERVGEITRNATAVGMDIPAADRLVEDISGFIHDIVGAEAYGEVRNPWRARSSSWASTRPACWTCRKGSRAGTGSPLNRSSSSSTTPAPGSSATSTGCGAGGPPPRPWPRGGARGGAGERRLP